MMKSTCLTWSECGGWQNGRDDLVEPQIVIVFGASDWMATTEPFADLRQRYPSAHIMGCSTGGQIVEDSVSEVVPSALVLRFERSHVRVAQVDASEQSSSFESGKALAAQLAAADLKAILVLSDGLHVNGSQLVDGLSAAAGAGVCIVGGLAGDGAAFARTMVHLDGVSREKMIVAAGLYGDALRVGYGSAGGWSVFGPKRAITRSSQNVLHELDGKSALDLYRSYLGDEAEGLPGTGLLYPLMITDPANPDRSLVRTLLAIDEANGSLTFAGDMPESWRAQLMRGHFDQLARAAGEASSKAIEGINDANSDRAAILISCIGRRILMGENIINEVFAARDVLGPDTAVAGFYSYGEIAPQGMMACSELHNQTMTVTTISERL